MTEQELRIEVCKLLKICTSDKWKKTAEWVEYNQDEEYTCVECGQKDGDPHHNIPNLTLDLCHEAEKLLSMPQLANYIQRLDKYPQGGRLATTIQRATALIEVLKEDK